MIKKVVRPEDPRYDGYLVTTHPNGGWISHPWGRRYDNYYSFTSYPTKEEALLAAGADPNKLIAPGCYAKLEKYVD
jgi:hypothetical protein